MKGLRSLPLSPGEEKKVPVAPARGDTVLDTPSGSRPKLSKKGFRSPTKSEPAPHKDTFPHNHTAPGPAPGAGGSSSGSSSGNDQGWIKLDKVTKDVVPYPYHTISPPITKALPTTPIEILRAPTPEKEGKLNWLSMLATPLGTVIVAVIMVLATGAVSMVSPLMMLPMSVISVLVTVLNHVKQKKDAKKATQERESKYFSYLSDIEQKLQETSDTQRAILNEENPSAALCSIMDATSRNLWSRATVHSNFMSVRLGLGSASLCVPVRAPEKHYDVDNPLDDRARELADRYRTVTEIPHLLDFKAMPSVGIIGERDQIVEQALAMVVNAAAMHSYEALKIMVIYPREEEERWRDLRWLPHVFDERRQARFIACRTADTKPMLAGLQKLIEERAERSFTSSWGKAPAEPHILVVFADSDQAKGSEVIDHLTRNDPLLSISSLFLASDVSRIPQKCKGIIELHDGRGIIYDAAARNLSQEYMPDRISATALERFCRTMAPIRAEGAKSTADIPGMLTFLNAWNVDAPAELPVEKYWASSSPAVSMQVPLGAMAEGRIFGFDLHHHVHGAHGMYVGTAGSGKTTMVRSWILSMALRFSPKHANFVLVDFKGSGLLDGLVRLPHVVGTISNLDKDIRRNLTALESEIERREKYFEERGYKDIYECYKKGDRSIPYLFIVIDELNEFKLWSASGDDNRMKLLDRLYQVGRSLGMHMIAGSQTTQPFTDTMEKNAQFRWCLKTTTADDSKYLLKTDDAFNITTKGRAFVRVGSNEVYEEIQPLYADGPYMTPEILARAPEREMAMLDLRGNRSKAHLDLSDVSMTQLDAVVEHICSVAKCESLTAPRKIWPDRLPITVHLAELAKPAEGKLVAAIGLVDDPKGQQQYTLTLDPQRNGHVVVYGAPRTGKSTFLRTAALSLLSHCSAEKMRMYLVGSEFKPFWDCPQVVASSDSFGAKSVIAPVYAELMRRKKSGLTAEDLPLLLFVDDIGEQMGDLKAEFIAISQFGAGCQVYLFASAGKQADVMAISSYLTRGYALWFADSLYEYRSVLAEKNVDRIPSKEIPGRTIFYDSRTMEFQTALPWRSDAELQKQLQSITTRYPRPANVTPVTKKGPGEVLLGRSTLSHMDLLHDFREQNCLLMLGNDPGRREQVLTDLAKELLEQPDVFQAVSIGAQIPGTTFLPTGKDVDDYLQSMFEELKKRNELQKKGAQEFPKYIFLVADWDKCLESVTELSRRRFRTNVIQKGKLLGIQLVAACGWEDFRRRVSVQVTEPTETHLLGSRPALLLDHRGGEVAPCHEERFKKADGSLRGDLYLTVHDIQQLQIGGNDHGSQ